MKPEQARALVTETFPQTFDKGRFHHFVKELLNGFDESKAAPMAVPDAFAPHVRSCSRLGTYESPDGELADVLIVKTTEPWKLERTRTALRDFVAHKLKRGDSYKEAGLVAFVAPDARSWRFSFVRMEYESKRDTKTGKIAVEERLTPARRFSYIVGENESCHTAQSRFLDLLQDTETKPPLAKIEEAFSVETVTDEFFRQYKELFLGLKDELDKLAKKDPTIAGEFAEKKVKTEDFAKKLMGQIVFLYFLQKKGWLGVLKGGDWGSGPHNFLRRLFSAKFGDYKNFFNDILEPLFYGTLADDRTKEKDWSDKFNCRIPFLNGGLFEPLRDYDWNKTDIIIPNRIFANSDFVEQGVTGTGILDVFDRYNFTVNEAEPLEKEVAIDPEMLGKVFENLLEVKERKSKGSFYTPREIVHYMCQESLINYLDTAVNSSAEIIGREKRKQASFGDEKAEQTLLTAPAYRELVPRADLETFIHSGDQASHFEAARVEGTDYKRRLPKTIQDHARLLDVALKEITVCDPAIGSGAFPVGMMQEIVRARASLTPYLEDEIKKDKQLSEEERERRLKGLAAKTTVYALKKHAIQNCLYGVDIDPGAVEIAKLRLWLSLVVDEDDVKQIKPLPNLDYKIVVGNSLLGVEKNLFNAELFKRLEELKPKYFDATDRKQKEKFKHEIDGLIHELTNGKEAFDFEIYFSEIFHHKKGFDVAIANPPYGRLLTPSDEQRVGQQIPEFRATSDVFVAFILRGLSLTSTGGALSFIIPTAWLGGPNYSGLRASLLKKCINQVIALPCDMFEAAYVDTLVLQAQNKPLPPDHFVRAFTYPKRAELRQFIPGPWEIIPQSEWGRTTDKKFLLTKGMVELAAKFQKHCRRTCADVVEMKRGVLFDRSLLTSKKSGTNSHRYFEGDVYRYQLNFVAPSWVEFGSDMKERPQEFRWFESERILLRRLVNRQQRLMATLVTETFITNKNLYSLLPKRGAPAIRALLGILNSFLLSRLYIEAVSQATKDDFPQVTITDLLRLPIATA